MPLREVGEFPAWVEREAPSVAAQPAVRSFLVEARATPWLWPSVPIPDLSDQPEYEMRTAVLTVAGEHAVQVWYLHDYITDAIDIIAVTSD